MKDKCCNYCKHYDPMEGVCLLTKKIVDYLDGYCKKYKEDDFFKNLGNTNRKQSRVNK